MFSNIISTNGRTLQICEQYEFSRHVRMCAIQTNRIAAIRYYSSTPEYGHRQKSQISLRTKSVLLLVVQFNRKNDTRFIVYSSREPAEKKNNNQRGHPSSFGDGGGE